MVPVRALIVLVLLKWSSVNCFNSFQFEGSDESEDYLLSSDPPTTVGITSEPEPPPTPTPTPRPPGDYIDGCGDPPLYSSWTWNANMTCSRDFPTDLPDDNNLDNTTSTGFFYARSPRNFDITALYYYEDDEKLTMTIVYFSTRHINVFGVLPDADDAVIGLPPSVGGDWTTRRLLGRGGGFPTVFTIDFSTGSDSDFFVLDKIFVTIERDITQPTSSTTPSQGSSSSAEPGSTTETSSELPSTDPTSGSSWSPSDTDPTSSTQVISSSPNPTSDTDSTDSISSTQASSSEPTTDPSSSTATSSPIITANPDPSTPSSSSSTSSSVPTPTYSTPGPASSQPTNNPTIETDPPPTGSSSTAPSSPSTETTTPNIGGGNVGDGGLAAWEIVLYTIGGLLLLGVISGVTIYFTKCRQSQTPGDQHRLDEDFMSEEHMEINYGDIRDLGAPSSSVYFTGEKVSPEGTSYYLPRLKKVV